MKYVFLFCTKLKVYWVELPILILLYFALIYNEKSEEVFKLYPLITALIIAAIFVMVYFFRAVTISTDEVRCHGIFSSRDKAFISEGRTLVIALHGKRKIKLELLGAPDEEPAFEWMKNETPASRATSLFRESAVGGKSTAERILKYFDVPEDDAKRAVCDESFSADYEYVSVKSLTNSEVHEVHIRFNKTII